MEQTNEGNIRFFVQNSPISEAGQNFDQFISPSRPKHCTKSWTSPPNLKKADAPAREPKSVREQNHVHGNKSAEQRNKTNGPVRESSLKIPSAKWEIAGARAQGRRTRNHGRCSWFVGFGIYVAGAARLGLSVGSVCAVPEGLSRSVWLGRVVVASCSMSWQWLHDGEDVGTIVPVWWMWGAVVRFPMEVVLAPARCWMASLIGRNIATT
jgi:hypothetical protein